MIRVVIVDDSATVTELLRMLLGAENDIEVVGVARNGADAVALARTLRPDVVTMDVAMPGMDGLEATRIIMNEAPTCIVMVSAPSNRQQMDLAFEALQAGAMYAFDKPDNPLADAFGEWGRTFLATIRALADVKPLRRMSEEATGPRTARSRASAEIRITRPAEALSRVRIAAIGLSLGGPQALHTVLAALFQPPAVPVLVTQHISKGFVAPLAAWLSGASGVDVRVAQHGEAAKPGAIYFAPDDGHLGVTAEGVIVIDTGPPVARFRPSASRMFALTAEAFGPDVLAIIMTGMGSDGLEGLRTVRSARGRIVAQDSASSVIWGMPGAAVEAGLADEIASLSGIAELLALAGRAPDTGRNRVG